MDHETDGAKTLTLKHYLAHVCIGERQLPGHVQQPQETKFKTPKRSRSARILSCSLPDRLIVSPCRMNQLHASFTLKNQKAFRQLLDRAPPAHGGGGVGSSGSSAPRSWTIGSILNAPPVDVNARDAMGRTVLHRACSSLEVSTQKVVGHLFTVPLYAGNLAATVLLLQHPDVDVFLKDYDGYTPFDLYNSTVENTRPSHDGEVFDLFTWGVNRNAALGLGDANDRAYPEVVNIPRSIANERKVLTGSAGFYPLQAKGIDMSKLHTAIITSEKRGNLRLCGFGSGGRLGAGHSNTQYTLVTLASFEQYPNAIVSVACGQDHTLALTSSGEVLSWGLNRFSQLGYVVEIPSSRSEEPIQSSPRKVTGALKNKCVIGVAACRMASVAWSDTMVYAWGTNGGQLGFQELLQVQPRAVSAIADPVLSISITDAAMHPPITKITCCENTFAALSELGDVFTFTVDVNSSEPQSSGKDKDNKWTTIKPQRVWSLRKQMSAVVDMALGADGTLILCTESGHVFVRSRNVKPGNNDKRRQQLQQPSQSQSMKLFKFQRIPFLQRIVKVCSNSTGAFAALRQEVKPTAIGLCGNSLNDDLVAVRPFVVHPTHHSLHIDDSHQITSIGAKVSAMNLSEDLDDASDEDSDAVTPSIRSLSQLLGALAAGKSEPLMFILPSSPPDVPLSFMYSKDSAIENSNIRIVPCAVEQRLQVFGCHALTVLLLLHYIYADAVPAFWDRRVSEAMKAQLSSAGIVISTIKMELRNIARILELEPLRDVLDSISIRALKPTLATDMEILFNTSQGEISSPNPRGFQHSSARDILIKLADREVACHSFLLRARSPFFASFLADKEWTSRRWKSGLLYVNFEHLQWKPMSFVFKYLYQGTEISMFDGIDFANNIDEFIDFVFSVLACATELLLDRLVLICSSVILRHVSIMNVSSLLADASFYHATDLVNRLQEYAAINLECLLESHLLDEMAPDLISQFASFIRSEQARKLPISRSNRLIDEALAKNAEWLALQDIPQPMARSSKAILAIRNSPRLSPLATTIGKPNRRSPPATAPVTPSALKAVDALGDGIFAMDDEPIPAISLDSPTPSKTRSDPKEEPQLLPVATAWKGKAPYLTSKVDLKTVMAEAESGRSPGSPSGSRTRVVGFQPTATPSPTVSSIPRDTRKPWGVPETAPSSSSLSRGSPSSFPPPSTPNSSGPLPSKVTAPRRPISRPGGVPYPTHLGSVITPARILSGDLSAKRRGPSDAWTTPPPVAPSPPSTSGVSTPSFTLIQQQQQEQLSKKGKAKQSLLDIQQEEADQQAEIDFMKWWTAEEERLRLESVASNVGGPSSPSDRGRGGRRGGKSKADKVDDRPSPSRISRGKSTGRGRGHHQMVDID
ncbi:hypothetical protein BS47DRAFT_1390126 [Hydnum rufescens UP504]|uniref:BTB domain-containing protein n=1 Tax=Hydnum rufescens UP504 TaxID=1448309 RepID=A0A9P6B6A0_9AGAM|nr:hypothetical protein BS47DRAFT_1390126 [Hydnum rufescens UP504]